MSGAWALRIFKRYWYMLQINKSCIMLDLEGLVLTPDERELLAHPCVYGVILFTRNYATKQQLKELIAGIKSINAALVIGVDQEGGRVQRLRDEFYPLPAAAEIGKCYDENPTVAENRLRALTKINAQELKEVGIDLNFAPVLDLAYGQSKVIGSRSFHAQPEVVARLGAIYIQELQRYGVRAVAKHFPGHGYATADSHFAVAADERDESAIIANDLVPFVAAIANHVDGIMPGHVIYSKVDEMPAGFSSSWLQKILRQQLKFIGTIFSDDLTMFAASGAGDLSNRVEQALRAGCDVVLICNNRKGVKEIICH